ncbi:NAD(P)/FAD-dependent oxidoreductase [Desulfallas thermosapovorans]|uniref:Pyridine nucleotide-disulfide oxidoreductase n=1 Tax=Desulfallas thermosapovorans DSM 6562 TaxID=1121431 RepID=A0A5S4ZTM8_9FIRM|nr:FAD-dependent oxidoreductase [Desulfallas thermosapovorans]TYO96213.1 pyridine nucleotide-disulfide oxidoreductase [Desulfallas thermosapovorans DSM 6562]
MGNMGDYDYLIIGNSAGAVGCIEGLRSMDKNGTVALVAEEEHHVYSRALIPYYLGGQITRNKMYYRPRDFYDRARVSVIKERRAVKIHSAVRMVELDNGSRLGYGKLLLATGGKPVYPPISGLDKQQNVFSFHSMKDVLGIERELPAVRSAVVLGGGVIGLMAAEVLHKRGLDVHVLELADRLLAPVVDETTSHLVEGALQKAGVTLYLNNTIDQVHGTQRVESVTLKDGRSIPCDLLIVGVGVAPRVELAQGTGIEVNRGIVVDKNMQTAVPGIYACGDCASTYNFVTGAGQNLPLWPNAYLGGRIAGFNMAGMERAFVQGTAMNAMHFFDINIINAGINVTGAETPDGLDVIQEYNKDTQTYRKFILSEKGHIKGFILVGQIARAGIFLNLMRRKTDVRAFIKDLFKTDFGYADLPETLRWKLLQDDVILGVV